MRTPLLTLLALGTGCASADNFLSGASYDESADDTGSSGADGGYGGGDDADSAPPEQEDDFLRLAPAATNAYVFVANPTRNTVTRIAVPSLAVDTRTVGSDPVTVATSSDYTHAVTFNAGSDDVSIIDAESFDVTTVGVRDNFNTMAMSPDGEWVMCWYDEDIGPVDPSGGVQSFNEVSFVNLRTATHYGMVVGFNPQGVRWTPDGTLALVVSDGALAMIDLTEEELSPTLVELADDPLDAPPAEEVELSPNGDFAFVRQFGTDEILVVSLMDRTYDAVPVGQNPTDLDLSPDGRSVAVVSRGSHELYVFDSEDPFAEPQVLSYADLAEYGSVQYAGDGRLALLYTNAAPVPKYTVWDTQTGELTERTLVKPIRTLGISPTGGTALIFHTESDAPDADPNGTFYGEWALTMVDIASLRASPILLPAEPKAYTTSEDGRHGFFIMEGLEFLETLHFDSLLYDEVRLKSEPVYVGVLPGTSLAYASQEHELGRISFYDPDTEALDTVTGFELNSEIDHEER